MFYHVKIACYQPRERESLWDDLVQIIKDYPTIVEAPWFLARDFNCICRVNERQGGRIPQVCNMETFNDFIFRAVLIEPPTLGDTWTWCNERQAGARIYERIDRCFTNSIAMVQYPITVTATPLLSSPPLEVYDKGIPSPLPSSYWLKRSLADPLVARSRKDSFNLTTPKEVAPLFHTPCLQTMQYSSSKDAKPPFKDLWESFQGMNEPQGSSLIPQRVALW